MIQWFYFGRPYKLQVLMWRFCNSDAPLQVPADWSQKDLMSFHLSLGMEEFQSATWVCKSANLEWKVSEPKWSCWITCRAMFERERNIWTYWVSMTFIGVWWVSLVLGSFMLHNPLITSNCTSKHSPPRREWCHPVMEVWVKEEVWTHHWKYYEKTCNPMIAM